MALLFGLMFQLDAQASTLNLSCTTTPSTVSDAVVNTDPGYTDTIQATGLQVGDVVTFSTTLTQDPSTNFTLTGGPIPNAFTLRGIGANQISTYIVSTAGSANYVISIANAPHNNTNRAADWSVTCTRPVSRIINIDGTGTGTGTVAGTAPSTINCTSTAGTDTGTCSNTVTDGTVVILTATAAAGSTFTGWTSCDSVAANVCTQTVSGGNETVQANFGPDPKYVQTQTQRVISNFMSRRADQITANDPDLVSRLLKSGANGSGGPVGFTADRTGSNNQFAFSTSLQQMFASAEMAKVKQELGQVGLAPGTLAEPYRETSSFDIWAEGKWAHFDDETRDGDIGLLYVGTDYRVHRGLLIGVLAQFDWLDETDRTEDIAVDGKGWMAGP